MLIYFLHEVLAAAAADQSVIYFQHRILTMMDTLLCAVDKELRTNPRVTVECLSTD